MKEGRNMGRNMREKKEGRNMGRNMKERRNDGKKE